MSKGARHHAADNHTWTPADDEFVRSMAQEGFSSAQIAGRLGVTRSAVIGRAKRKKIPLSRQHANASRRKPGTRNARRWQVIKARRAELSPLREVTIVPDLPPPVDYSECVHLLDMTERMCKWPMWPDHEQPNQMFCGNPKDFTKSYCPHHTAVSGGYHVRQA